MSNIPKKVVDRLIKQTNRFKRILKRASDRDVNESDTVTIISDMLSDIFGFNKYSEVTSEYAIRGTYCDLAITINNDIKYLIEVKAIGLGLKNNHIRQAVNYGAREGVPWVVLTNGLLWEIYNIRLDKTVKSEKICTIDFSNINPRKNEDQEMLYLLCKEGLKYDVINIYHDKVKIVNRFIIGNLLSHPDSLSFIRRELRRLSPGLKVDEKEIESILLNEILKRDVIEGEYAKKAQKQIKLMKNKILRKKLSIKKVN